MAHVLASELRNSVLQAAMSGKLTHREANDTEISVKESFFDDEIIPFEIPSHWKFVKLGDMFHIRSATRVHQSDWTTNGVPFYRAREVVKLAKNGCVDNELFISDNLFEKFKSNSGVPSAGDLLVSGVGTLGATYIVKDGDKFYYKDASVLCFENTNEQNPLFAKYLMETPYMVEQIYDQSAFGTTVATLTMKRANEFIVALPPIEEQARIVARVDELMAEIDEYEKIENQLVELKKNFPENMKAAVLQAAMQGKMSVRELSDSKPYVTKRDKSRDKGQLYKVSSDSIPYDIPDGWMWQYLGETIYLLSGQDLTSDRYSDEEIGIPYLTGASNFNSGNLIINRYTTSGTSIADEGDLLITCKGTIGEMAYLSVPKAHIARQIMAIKACEGMSIRFIEYYLRGMIDALNAKAHSIIPGIDRKTILNSLIPVPPIEEQKRIVEKLDRILPLCESLEL